MKNISCSGLSGVNVHVGKIEELLGRYAMDYVYYFRVHDSGCLLGRRLKRRGIRYVK